LTDYHASAVGKWLFHGDKVVDNESKKTLSINAHRPVIDNNRIYFASKGQAIAYDLVETMVVEKKDRRGQMVKVLVPKQLWRFGEQPVTNIHVRAGNRIYGHHKNSVFALDVPESDGGPKITWKSTVEGTPSSMVVANGKLYVVTKEGGIHCFAANETEAKSYSELVQDIDTASEKWAGPTAEILQQTSAKRGYCLVLGIGSGKLVDELVRQSQFELIVIDPDANKIAALRQRMDEKGLYGTRVVAQTADPRAFEFPPYLANLIVSEDLPAAGFDQNSVFARRVFHALRPYGGIACFELSDEAHRSFTNTVQQSKLPNAELKRLSSRSTLSRVGALVDSADWTHEYGDPANTLMSRDKLVKAPLGVLWFGGPSSDGSLFFDRHQWGPSMAVIEGRMFIQGPQVFTAVDVYTGRILWQNRIAAGVTPGRRSNWGPTGFHFVAVTDAVYLAFPDKCVRLDPASGKEVAQFKLENDEDLWGRIRIWKDQIIVPVFQPIEGGKPLPKKLVSMDRHSGEVSWSKESLQSFPMVAIGGDKVFCYEGILKGLYKGADKIRKDGIPEAKPFLSVKAFNAKTGEELWDRTTTQVATWLAYSDEHDVLLTSNKQGIIAQRGKDGEELWKKESKGEGFRGHPENYWDKVIIWKDRIIDQRGPGRSYSLLSGESTSRPHPITGQEVPWEFTKIGHHCNYAIASEHLMTFRAASAGFCDLESGGTGRLVGFRSGCRNSLIPANGVMNAPNFAHGCVCSYSIFTSLALVNVPETDFWTYSALKEGDGPIDRLGINLGAEGDRRADNGTMWLDYPNVGGPSPVGGVKVTTESPRWFRLHSSQIQGKDLKWVAASGVRGVRSITIPLHTGKAVDDAEPRNFKLRLFFTEPNQLAVGENVFNVELEGRRLLSEFDIVEEAGGPRKTVVKEFDLKSAGPAVTISFHAQKGETLISGVEVVAE